LNKPTAYLAQADAALVNFGDGQTLEKRLLAFNVSASRMLQNPTATSFPIWAFPPYTAQRLIFRWFNLICGKEVVKELFAKFFTVDAIREGIVSPFYLSNDIAENHVWKITAEMREVLLG